MTNISYVDEILENENDEIARHLLELFRELIRDPQSPRLNTLLAYER